MSTEDFDEFAARQQVRHGCNVILKRCRPPSPVGIPQSTDSDTTEKNDEDCLRTLQTINEYIASQPDTEQQTTYKVVRNPSDSLSAQTTRISSYVPSSEEKIKTQETLDRVKQKTISKRKAKSKTNESHIHKKKKHFLPYDGDFLSLGGKSKTNQPHSSSKTRLPMLSSDENKEPTISLLSKILRNPNLTFVAESQTNSPSLATDGRETNSPPVAHLPRLSSDENKEPTNSLMSKTCPNSNLTVVAGSQMNSHSLATEGRKTNSPPVTRLPKLSSDENKEPTISLMSKTRPNANLTVVAENQTNSPSLATEGRKTNSPPVAAINSSTMEITQNAILNTSPFDRDVSHTHIQNPKANSKFKFKTTTAVTSTNSGYVEVKHEKEQPESIEIANQIIEPVKRYTINKKNELVEIKDDTGKETAQTRLAASVPSRPAGPMSLQSAAPVLPTPTAPVSSKAADPDTPKLAAPVSPKAAAPVSTKPAGPVSPKPVAPLSPKPADRVSPKPAAPITSKVGTIKVRSLKELIAPTANDQLALPPLPQENTMQAPPQKNITSQISNTFQRLLLKNPVVKNYYNIMIQELKTILENQADKVSKKKAMEVKKLNFPRFRDSFRNCLLNLESFILNKEVLEQEKSAVVQFLVTNMLKKFHKKTILKAMMDVLYYSNDTIDSLMTSGSLCNAVDAACKEFKGEKSLPLSTPDYNRVTVPIRAKPVAVGVPEMRNGPGLNDQFPSLEPLRTCTNVNQNFQPRPFSSTKPTAGHLLNVVQPPPMATNASHSPPIFVGRNNMPPNSRPYSSNAHVSNVARADPRLNPTYENVFPAHTANETSSGNSQHFAPARCNDPRINSAGQASFVHTVGPSQPPHHQSLLNRAQPPAYSEMPSYRESAPMLMPQRRMVPENTSQYYVPQYQKTVAAPPQPAYGTSHASSVMRPPNALSHHNVAPSHHGVTQTFSQPYTKTNRNANFSHTSTRDPRTSGGLEAHRPQRVSVIHQVPSAAMGTQFVDRNVNAHMADHRFVNQQSSNSIAVQNAVHRNVNAVTSSHREYPVSNAFEKSQPPLSVPYVNSSVSPSNAFPESRDLNTFYPSDPYTVEQPISVPIVQSTCRTPDTQCESNANVFASEQTQKIGFEENVTEFDFTAELLKQFYQMTQESARNDNIFG